MKKVFICSPLRGNYTKNINRAQHHSRNVALSGSLPLTPHLYFTTFLNDDKEEERKIGMEMGLELLKLCDEVNVYGEPTEGMKEEIKLANKLKIKVKYYDNIYTLYENI